MRSWCFQVLNTNIITNQCMDNHTWIYVMQIVNFCSSPFNILYIAKSFAGKKKKNSIFEILLNWIERENGVYTLYFWQMVVQIDRLCYSSSESSLLSAPPPATPILEDSASISSSSGSDSSPDSAPTSISDDVESRSHSFCKWPLNY